MYAIIRGDLDMPPGKLASQAGHAFTNTLLKSLETDRATANHYEQTDGNIGTKICLKAKSLHKILEIQKQAVELGINNQLIVDSGHIMLPYFDGNPIVTALGIGPLTKEQAHFLRKLELVK